MTKKPRADDDDDINICIGTGCIGELRDGSSRDKVVRRAIGFVHFPDKPEKKARSARMQKPKQERRRR